MKKDQLMNNLLNIRRNLDLGNDVIAKKNLADLISKIETNGVCDCHEN